MEFSGRTTDYSHKHGEGWRDNKNAGDECLKTVKFLDVQWSNCPVEIEDFVRKEWRRRELGNDNYFFQAKPSDYLGENKEMEFEVWEWGDTREEQKGWVWTEVNTQFFGEWLLSKGVEEDETVFIHWWW